MENKYRKRAIELYSFCTGVEPAEKDIEAMIAIAEEVEDNYISSLFTEKTQDSYKRMCNKLLDNFISRPYLSEEKEEEVCKAMYTLAEIIERAKDLQIEVLQNELNIFGNHYTSNLTVEDLLKKQRELCAKNACVDVDFDGTEFTTINENSILNAKLKIN